MCLYLEPGNISSLRWFCVEIDTAYQSEDGFINKEDDSSDFYPYYVFSHLFTKKKESQPGM